MAIENINTSFPEEIIHALEKDTHTLLDKVEQYNRHVLYLDHIAHYPQKTHDDYVTIKKMEDKLIKCIVTSHTLDLNQEHSTTINILNDVIAHALTSSKYLKDIQNHIINLKDESIEQPFVADSLHFFQEMMQKTCDSIHDTTQDSTAESNVAALENTISMLHTNDDYYLENISTKRDAATFEKINIAEVIKTNRYVLLSCEALLKAHCEYIKK